ncbi:MAG: PaaI family thioesterase [Nitrospinae bacterium]|nr:PaaI family thioesterase [Nitrospinota bacterium]
MSRVSPTRGGTLIERVKMARSWTREEVERVFQARWQGNFNDLLGFEVLEAEEGFARVAMPVEPKLHQPFGIIHGGALASLADTVGGVGSYVSYPVGTEVVTVEMKINFVRPVKEGTLIGEAKALHLGRKTSVWEMRIVDDAEKLVCFASATYMVIKEA